jgi:hypothetical protein
LSEDAGKLCDGALLLVQRVQNMFDFIYISRDFDTGDVCDTYFALRNFGLWTGGLETCLEVSVELDLVVLTSSLGQTQRGCSRCRKFE